MSATTYSRVKLLRNVLVFVFACGCVHRQTDAAAAIRLTEDSVVFTNGPSASFFRITSIVRNVGQRTLYQGGCGPDVQRKMGDDWLTVFRLPCQQPMIWSLSPGDSIILPITALGFTRPNEFPSLDPNMRPGFYRLLFGLGTKASEAAPLNVLRVEKRVSPTFVVK
jgi:hypothetical protein